MNKGEIAEKRAAFEKWMLNQWPNTSVEWCDDCSNPHYVSILTCNLFDAFQAGERAIAESRSQLRQKVVQLARGNMAIAQMIDAEFGRFEERAIAESQAKKPKK